MYYLHKPSADTMGIVTKFCAGMLMTIVFVIMVPYITENYINPYLVEIVGDSGFMFLSSQALIQFLMILVMCLFMILLGGGAVLRMFGIFGVLGLITAYYLLGDVTDAFIPVLSLAVIYIITIPMRKKKTKDESDR
jgi:hypothetical protein